MKILVTGAAGFIGSHLCKELLTNEDYKVIGLDYFIGPTPQVLKDSNLKSIIGHPRFHLVNDSILRVNLDKLLDDIDVIYHLAAIPGVRSSWGKEFHPYLINNVSATQKLLEACKNRTLKKFIYTSTSSIYGEKIGKVQEDSIPKPLSPYGISKLSGEHLCYAYHKSFGIPVVILRYFTVYGPGQRPDMAFHRFIKHLIKDEEITIFGDGKQTRDFTFIDDCAKATASVLESKDVIGEIINIGGKERSSILEVIALLEKISGKKAKIEYQDSVKGEPKHTWADITKAKRLLNYSPTIKLEEGLKKEFDFFKKIYGDDSK